jgi:N-carbamoylputrescine amidase
MKTALVVNHVSSDREANLASILVMAGGAADKGVDLIVFPEAALTGLINDDDPLRDLALGEPIPGPVTGRLSAFTRARGVWLAIGLLERDGGRLYDSAVLISPDGEIGLKYRRMQPQWHRRGADPSVYCQGDELTKADTPLGSFVFLVCGDLFDDAIAQRARGLRPDWVLFPFARCFGDGSHDQERWDSEEAPNYVERVRRVGCTAFMTNYLSGEGLHPDGLAFGGAMVVSGDGRIVDSFPLGRAGMLVVEV